MGRRSKSVENFLRSIDEYYERGAELASVRTFKDELFIFGEFRIGGRRRPEDYVILGDRRRGESLMGKSLLGAFPDKKPRDLYDALESGNSFAIIPWGEKVAIIYLGLYYSCRIGIMSLTYYTSRIVSALGPELRGVLGDVWFAKSITDVVENGNPCAFITDFMTFREEILAACGIDENPQVRGGVERMIYSSADLIGCGIKIDGVTYSGSERVERDTSAAIFLSILSAVRSISRDRSVTVTVGERDGDAVVDLSFQLYGELTDERMSFIKYAQSFSKRHSIPFSYDVTDGICRVSFMPIRLDPSEGGLKAGVTFELGRGGPRRDFYYAR